MAAMDRSFHSSIGDGLSLTRSYCEDRLPNHNQEGRLQSNAFKTSRGSPASATRLLGIKVTILLQCDKSPWQSYGQSQPVPPWLLFWPAGSQRCFSTAALCRRHAPQLQSEPIAASGSLAWSADHRKHARRRRVPLAPAPTGGRFQGRFAFLWQPLQKTLDALGVNGHFFTPADLASWIKHDVGKRMLVLIDSNGIRSFHASFSFPVDFALRQP